MRPEVLRGVFAGGGVDADGSVLFGDGRELVGDDVLLRFGLCVLEGFMELCELWPGLWPTRLRYSAS